MTDVHDSSAGLVAQYNAHRGALDLAMGIEYLEVAPGRVVARMPVAGNTQPFGILHGGASVVLAESIGSFMASVAARPRVAFGTEVSASHHRQATSGWVTATCTPLFEGRSSATYEIVVRDDAGERVCTARLTCVLRMPPEGAPER